MEVIKPGWNHESWYFEDTCKGFHTQFKLRKTDLFKRSYRGWLYIEKFWALFFECSECGCQNETSLGGNMKSFPERNNWTAPQPQIA